MAAYSYHASHEQFSPSDLIKFACLAEVAGFDAVFCSDHLQPWSTTQGHSGHTWSWLGAALQATRRMSFGTITVPGGWRYHPVVLAQAIGTLGEMFPGRMPWLAFGSGEALNEMAVGEGWPDRPERHRRLQEGVRIVRDLLQGKQVTHQGAVPARDARTWDRPAQLPRLFGAAMSEQTAHWLGSWADGLLTLGRDLEGLRRIIAAFHEGGGAGKPIHVKLDVLWSPSPSEGENEAHRNWRFTCLNAGDHHDLSTPEAFEAAAAGIDAKDMHRHVLITADPLKLVAHVRGCQDLGASAVNIHHVGHDQIGFIEMCGASLLPELRLR